METLTENKIDLYLRVKFPYFSRPLSSRFIPPIDESGKDENNEPVYSKKFFDVNIKKIKSGVEKRTTLLIKGFPSRMAIDEVSALLQQYTKNINFFFIPEKVKEEKEYMYCFVNVLNVGAVLGIYLGLTNLKDKYKFYNGYNFSKIEICFSKNQGLKALQKKFLTHQNF